MVEGNEELRADKGGNAIRKLRAIVSGIQSAQASSNGVINKVVFTKLPFKTTTPNSLEYGVKHFSDLIDNVSVGKINKDKLPLEQFIIKIESDNGKNYLKIYFKPYDRSDETLVLSAEYKKDDTPKQDNNSLENRRLEWRVARLEHLIEERFGRN